MTVLPSEGAMTVEEVELYVQWCVNNNRLDLLISDIYRLETIETSDPKFESPNYLFILTDKGSLIGSIENNSRLDLGPLSYELLYPNIRIENFYTPPKPKVTVGETIFISIASALVGGLVGAVGW